MANDNPIGIEKQIDMMKKYVYFRKRVKMRRLLQYAGYFRISRYGKYLISFSNVFSAKPTQDMLFELYNLDLEIKKIMYEACAKAEINIKSIISNSMALKTDNPTFYLDEDNYTATRGERNRSYRERNIRNYTNFYTRLSEKEEDLRNNKLKYPELKEYRKGGKRFNKKLPCWAVFSYLEFGTIQNIYSYLRGDLRKEVLKYGYTRESYSKVVTSQMDTWLNGIRILRNICAHHSKLIGMQEAIVLADSVDDSDILISNEDLFSRIYALKKVMRPEDSELMKKKLSKLLHNTKLDVYKLEILPSDWEERFDRIKSL